MGFGAIVKCNYDGYCDGNKTYKFLQKPVMFIASVPVNIRKIIKFRTFNLDKPQKLTKHKDKKRFEQFIPNKRNALLVLPRYDHSLRDQSLM